MSLLFNPELPKISPTTIVVGALYSHATSFIVQRPLLGALFSKARVSEYSKETLKSQEAQTALASLATSAAASSIQSYGVAALLHLANVNDYKGAAIVGGLVLTAQIGPQLIRDLFVLKQPLDVVLSTVAVKVLDTVGLALTLQWYNKGFIAEQKEKFIH